MYFFLFYRHFDLIDEKSWSVIFEALKLFYDFFLFSENKQGVEGYVEKALKRRIEKKVQEIDEYRASTLFAKTINHQLHEKMVDAEKQRSDALYKDLPSDFFESV